jgi:hypothetical protein
MEAIVCLQKIQDKLRTAITDGSYVSVKLPGCYLSHGAFRIAQQIGYSMRGGVTIYMNLKESNPCLLG